MIKLLIFDMDGTLFDTDDVIVHTWLELFKEFKPKDFHMDLETIQGFSGPPLSESLSSVFPERNLDFMTNEYGKRTRKYYDTDIKEFSGARKVIEQFKLDGYKLAILTSKNREMAIYSLKILNYEKYFDYVLTSSDIAKLKPDPTGINNIMNHFNVNKDETITIGDTDFDYLAAKNADVKVIMATMKKRIYQSKLIPFAFVNSYNELYKVVRNYDNN